MKLQRFLKSTVSAVRLVLHAILIGVVGGLGAVVYISILGFIYNFIFLGQLNFIYLESIYSPPSRWGIGIILIPILGSIPVVWLLKNYAANESGPSEPDVLHFVHRHEGKKRYLIEITKTFCSAITIGTGGSVGWEVPIVQLGATLSYLFGKIQHISAEYRIVLIAAGGAASLAAIFNAPLAGVAFALEILLFSFRISHVILIAISSFTGTLVWKLIFGSRALFHFSLVPPENMLAFFKQVIVYIPFGVLIGLGAALLVTGLRRLIIFFEKNIPNLYLRHGIGMGLVGVMLFLLLQYFGHYYISAMGFATIQDVIDFLLENNWLLILLCFCKLLSLCFTLGSGASGGLFSPSLFLGAILGGACGIAIQHLFPGAQIHIIYLVLAGMAGMLASVTGAMITSIVFALELSKSYYIILPLLLTVVIGTLVRLYLCPKGIYTFKLFQHGLMFNRKL